MKRKLTAKLNKYIESGAGAPLLVLGPRGVGKTHTVCEWAESRRERSIYVNLETDASARFFFENGSFETVKDAVYAFLGIDNGTDTDDILLILDEIQACRALCELFKASYRPFGIRICCVSSFAPKGLIPAFYCVYAAPLDFGEFLEFTGREWYSELIRGHFEKKKPVPQLLHNELLDMWDDYLNVGGMPAVIAEYMRDNESVNIPELQRRCLATIFADIEHYGDKKMRDIIEAVPEHISAGKRRFTFNLIRRGVTAAMYRDAIDALVSNRTVIGSRRLNSDDQFGITLFDAGIAGSFARSSREIAVERLEYHLLETSLCAAIGSEGELFFNDDIKGAKADLLYTSDVGLTAIDFTPGKGRREKSLLKTAEELRIAHIVHVGRENYNFGDSIVKIPVYASFLLA